jgi:16S rRNA (cytosine1407-C5)-methyltransferase
MQGLRTSENHPMRQISDRERGNLAQRQQRLLESALQAAKIGGQVVYSTCTLETEENESVLDAVLRKYPGTFKIQSVTHKLPGPAPALYADHLQEYRPEVRNAIRLWPHVFQTAGFFAALLEKTNQIPTIHQSAPTRAWDRSGLKRVPANVLNDLEKLLQDQYGFFLKNTLADYGLSLWLRGITLIALPDLLISHFFTFPVVSAGLTLGEFAPYGFLVSHDWATRFESQMKANRIQLQPEFVPAWLRGEDLREFPPRQLEHGGVLFMEDTTGRFLGRARAQKDRLKNLLPRRLTL